MRTRLASAPLALLLATAAVALCTAAAPAARPGRAATAADSSGATSSPATWLPADKQGFGTSTTRASKVWFTLQGGELSEVYYPRLDLPSFRDLQFVVSDGRSFADAETTSTLQRAVLPDGRALVFRQINTDRAGRWQLVKTYVTDPARATVLIQVGFRSLTHRAYHVYLVADPQLDNGTGGEHASCGSHGLVTRDAAMADAIVTSVPFAQSACSVRGSATDGLSDLLRHRRLTAHPGIAVGEPLDQVALTPLTGLPGHRALTVAIAFAADAPRALRNAGASLRAGFARVQAGYAAGWHRYLSSLRRPPSSLRTAPERREYAVSAMVLAASEDKTFPGAYVASPTMPWAWGNGLQTPSGPYHLVWARDLYEIATALIADGDVAGARRALHFLFFRQQRPDGSFPQNSQVSGRPVLTGLQLDEVADPIILAWQLRAFDATSWLHVQRAANFIVNWHDSEGHAAPYTPQERWENQGGYSPATIAAEIAALVCAADIAKRNGDPAAAQEYDHVADRWRSQLNAWTLTHTGPYGPAYYLRLTKDGNPNAGTTYGIGDSGPAAIDQRRVVDPSFLELVRLGVLSPQNPNILATLGVVDRELAVRTPRGVFWHRYTDDGYGEQRGGGAWSTGFPAGSQTTIGRLWPIFTGERGEYELAAGHGAGPELAAMAAAANSTGLLPEQVWDQNPPAGRPGTQAGTPTTSATPLAWSQAQFIRLAWSIVAGAPVEQPAVVACRYVRACG